MTLNMERKLTPEEKSVVGKTVNVQPTPEQIRSMVLNAVAAGYNTMSALIDKTKLPIDVLKEEIRVMSGLYIVVFTDPVESFWMKGSAPRGEIYIENNRAYEVKKARLPKVVSATPEDLKEKNAEILARTEKDETNLPVPDFAGANEKAEERYCKEMPLILLVEHPDNPRGPVDEDEPAFAELVDSIKAVGVTEPIVVTPIENSKKFRIVVGHRRSKAAQAAGFDGIRCIVREFESKEVEEEVMLVENIQRQDLKPMQEARAFEKIYLRSNKDLNAVARKTGATQGTISNRMKLLNLDIGIQIMIDRGEIGLDAGTVLAQLDIEKQKQVLPRALKLNTAGLREFVRNVKTKPAHKLSGTRAAQIKEKRVTTDEEKFTRSGALKTLDDLGDGAWISVNYLKRAFDDVCLDSCLESKDQSICNGCPVPRFIHAVERHKRRKED